MSGNSAKRQLALEKELAQLVKVNAAVDSMISTIQQSQINIQKTKESTDHTGKLLEDWIRILSQTSFTNEILNNPKWNGKYGNEEEEEMDLETKLDQEQALITELKNLENENSHLLKKINAKEQHEAQDSRTRELDSRRQRDLGLGFRRRIGK